MQADLHVLLNGAMCAALHGRLQCLVDQNKAKNTENTALFTSPKKRWKNWALLFCVTGDVKKNNTVRAFSLRKWLLISVKCI